MDAQTKATLTNLDTWKRGVFMLVFAIISGLAKLLVTLVAIFQFITLLFKGQTNDTMLPFGQNLSTYLYQITLFLTFKTEEMPFPFNDFPDGPPDSTLHEDDKEDIATSESATKVDTEIVDTADENIKDENTEDEIELEKNTKDDSSKE
jgi:hypothetical protein